MIQVWYQHQENREVEAGLGYTQRPRLKQRQSKNTLGGAVGMCMLFI